VVYDRQLLVGARNDGCIEAEQQAAKRPDDRTF
jgi:hypothetical protein